MKVKVKLIIIRKNCSTLGKSFRKSENNNTNYLIRFLNLLNPFMPMLKNGQTYFKNLGVCTPEGF